MWALFGVYCKQTYHIFGLTIPLQTTSVEFVQSGINFNLMPLLFKT